MSQPDSDGLMAQEGLPSYREVVSGIAGLIGQPAFPRGDLAALRRMKPDAPSAPAFWRILTAKVPQPYRHGEDAERRWALIIHGMALMAPIHMASDPSIGRALSAIRLTELRLAKLLNARSIQFRAQVSRLARHLAAKGQPIDWRPLGQLILTESRDEGKAENIRMTIARDYFSAMAAQSK